MRILKLCNENGRPKYHLHALRHYFCSLLIEQKHPPLRIQKLMGHASISITFDVYGHLIKDAEDDQAAMAAMQRQLGFADLD